MADNTPVSKLPFLSGPTVETRVIGNERTGTLEFPVYRDLTVNEAQWLVANTGGKTAFQHTSKLALKIARNEKVKPIDAHGFVAKILATAMGTEGLLLDDDETTWSVRYVRELEECAMNVLEATTMTQTALVTCVIRHRLPGMQDWTPSDTANLPSELCQEILAFAMEERNRGEAEPTVEEAVAETEEALKKLKNEAEERIRTSESTGAPSTTSSESSIPPTPTSSAKRSASRKRATSSPASKKAPSSDETTITPSSSPPPSSQP